VKRCCGVVISYLCFLVFVGGGEVEKTEGERESEEVEGVRLGVNEEEGVRG